MSQYSEITSLIVAASTCYEEYLAARPSACGALDHPGPDIRTLRRRMERVDEALRIAPNQEDEKYQKIRNQWCRFVRPQLESAHNTRRRQERKEVEATTVVNDKVDIAPGQQQQQFVPYDRTHEEAERSKQLRQIARDTQELKLTHEEYAKLVKESDAPLLEAEQNVDASKKEVEEGVQETLQASKYKFAAGGLAMLGAVVGGLVAGPVGLVAGVQSGLGIAACVGTGAVAGGVATGTVGKVIHKKNAKVVAEATEGK